MPRKSNQGKYISNWSKLTINDITKMTTREINKLNNANLRAFTKRAADFAQRRFNRLYDAIKEKRKYNKNYPVPRVIHRNKIGAVQRRKFSVSTNDNRASLLSKAVEYRDFLRTKTSTLSGHNRNIERFINMVNERYGITIKSREEYNEFFEIYDAVLHVNEGEREKVSIDAILGKYETWRVISEKMKDRGNKTPMEIAQEIKDRLFSLEYYDDEDEELTGNFFVDETGRLD